MTTADADLRSSAVLGPVGQLGYVVHDAEAAAHDWARRSGIGPWRVMHGLRFDYCRTGGREVDMVVTIASAYSGGVEIELIAPPEGVPSMYADFLAAGGLGAHHVCFYPQDYATARASLEADGMVPLLEGALWGIPFVYLGDHRGQVIELGDLAPTVREGRVRRIAEAAAWDGTDPVRVRSTSG
jgi:hypothetical protein